MDLVNKVKTKWSVCRRPVTMYAHLSMAWYYGGRLTGTAQGVAGTQAVVSSFAAVTVGPLHVGLAAAPSAIAITLASVLRACCVTATTCATQRSGSGVEWSGREKGTKSAKYK